MTARYRADHIGSFLRPPALLDARRAALDPEGLRELEDSHIQRVLNMQKDIGFEIFTDGELRRSNFMSDFTDAVEGFDLGETVPAMYLKCETRTARLHEASRGWKRKPAFPSRQRT